MLLNSEQIIKRNYCHLFYANVLCFNLIMHYAFMHYYALLFIIIYYALLFIMHLIMQIFVELRNSPA